MAVNSGGSAWSSEQVELVSQAHLDRSSLEHVSSFMGTGVVPTPGFWFITVTPNIPTRSENC